MKNESVQLTFTKTYDRFEIELMDRYIESFNDWLSRIKKTRKTNIDPIVPGDYQSVLYTMFYKGITELESEINKLNSN